VIMREFRQKGRTAALLWTIELHGATETVRYGQLGGQMQEASHTYAGVNIGKSNELSPEEFAQTRVDKKIEEQRRAGYIEYVDGVATEVRVEAVSADEPLPTNLCFYKPNNKPGGKMLKLIEDGKAIFGRKRDGMMHVIRVTADSTEVYSRRMLQSMDKEPGKPWALRYPKIVEEFEAMAEVEIFPPNTVFLGEMVMDRGGVDDFTHVARVTKSLTHESLAIQAADGWVSYYIWDVAIWGGVEVAKTMSFAERQKLLEPMNREWLKLENWWVLGHTPILPLDVWTPSDLQLATDLEDEFADFPPVLTMATDLAKELDWEGFVVVDPTAVYGEKAFNFRGKPDRPRGMCAKVKPSYEDDFIARWDPEDDIGEYGKGKHQGMCGSVGLYQLNEAGEEVWICKAGGGIKDKFTKEYPDGLLRVDLSDKSIYPLVVEVEYDSRTYRSDGDKTDALRFPRIVRWRDDKAYEECVNSRL